MKRKYIRAKNIANEKAFPDAQLLPEKVTTTFAEEQFPNKTTHQKFRGAPTNMIKRKTTK